MPPFSLWLTLSSLLSTAVLASPVQSPFQIAPAFGDHYDSAPLKDSSLKGRFLHITDMHPDPHYRTDSSESTACHRKKPRKEKDRGGYYGLPYGDCDSPFSLTNLTLDFLDKHWAKEIDFVIWTGDTARHDNDREIPRTPDEIYDLNRAVVRRMTEVFTTRGIPVVPSLGNNDVWPHVSLSSGTWQKR
ncbi:vacuolar endopolyphosphatase [Pyrrhoderma noxium]|uniref:Vacuolar endopolyphosphatase n=1 Tax=Pyrrhoderma noxium TaxID=2282107 RepID=A0A286UN21_9AGAM|nr:vacuolar endopolyphosphatase [Pyrrhoderma noxium]